VLAPPDYSAGAASQGSAIRIMLWAVAVSSREVLAAAYGTAAVESAGYSLAAPAALAMLVLALL
jgi:hypothetical protein